MGEPGAVRKCIVCLCALNLYRMGYDDHHVTMPQMAILPAVVRDTQRRNTIIAMGAGVCAVSFTIGNTFTPNITAFFSGLGFQNPYIPFMLILG